MSRVERRRRGLDRRRKTSGREDAEKLEDTEILERRREARRFYDRRVETEMECGEEKRREALGREDAKKARRDEQTWEKGGE